MVEDTTEDTTTAPAEEVEAGQDSPSDVADLQVGEEASPEAVPEVPESEDREAA